MDELLLMLVSMNNELESLKVYVEDNVSLKIIQAKQDTLKEMYEFIQSKREVE